MFAIAAGTAAAEPANIDFARDVQPLLQQHCFECHGPSQQMRGLRLDRRRGAMPNRVGANNAVIVPGDSGRSALYLKLIGKRPGLTMPPSGPLSAEQIGILKTWIDEGAEWPDALSGEGSAAAPDAAVVRAMSALRGGARPEFRKALRDPAIVNRRGPRGDTLLQYAALYGDAEAIRLLLEAKADPNARNDAGATALMYAVDDAEKVRLLLAHHADPNVRSGEGRTALLMAAGRYGSAPVVKLLLDSGAAVTATDAVGRTVLGLAASAGDPALLRLLLERGAARQPLPLPEALAAGCSSCFELLLPLAAKPDLNRALVAACATGDLPAITILLERGAVPNSNVLANSVLVGESLPAETMRTLIERGKQANAGSVLNAEAVELARRQGKTAIAEMLLQAGAKAPPAAAQPVMAPKPAASIRDAVARSLPLLQQADVAFIARAGCVSCHNNSLTAMTVTTARKAGIRPNEQVASTQRKAIASYMDANRERALEGLGIPGGPDTVSYILLGLAAEKYPPDEITDAWAMFLKGRQSQDGHWARQALRPPIEASDMEVTAIAMRAIQVYGPGNRRAEFARAVQLASAWLGKAQPKTTGDLAFQLLGLEWTGAPRETLRQVAAKLLLLQRTDGGWGQTAALAPDSYATGQALFALSQTRALNVSNPAYQRGVAFLMKSQFEDGSWYVRTRVVPLQPYFESDFPHGADQFISAAATNWAAMALAGAVR